MDDWNAPQWADFNATVASDIDEYFNTEHKELEPRYACGTPYASFSESTDTNASLPNSSYNTPRSNGFASPNIAANSQDRCSGLNKTAENLANAMRSLQIKSAKKKLTRQSVANSPLRLKRATANARSSVSMTENEEYIETETTEISTVITIQASEENRTQIPLQEERQSAPSPEDEKAGDENSDANATLKASTQDEDRSSPEPVKNVDPTVIEKIEEIVNIEKIEEIEKIVEIQENEKIAEIHEIQVEESQSLESKLTSVLDPSKRPIADKKNNTKVSRPLKSRVLTSQVRRYSISKSHRRSGQYVSLAEAVARFQNGTPKRFRSTNHKDGKAGPPPKLKEAKMKLTCPMSPALRCKSRVRAASSSSQAASQARPKPVTKSASFPRSLSSSSGQIKSSINARAPRKIEKIPTIGVAEKKTAAAMNAPKVEKIQAINAPKVEKIQAAMDPPKVAAAVKKCEKMLEPSSSKEAALTMSSSMLSESKRKHTPCKKTVPTVVSTEEGIAIKDVEILHFGIPVGGDYKKITRAVPFSFETRNKELQSKKEKLQKQQQQQVEVEKSRKSLFHARPAPKKSVAAVLRPKENNANAALSALTFQQRNELALKKKRELMDQIVEKEKQARVFHAKPAPNFKPVFVRGNSSENLRTGGEAGKARTRGISPSARQKGLSQESVASANQENKPPVAANQQCPKMKNPMIIPNFKVKKSSK